MSFSFVFAFLKMPPKVTLSAPVFNDNGSNSFTVSFTLNPTAGFKFVTTHTVTGYTLISITNVTGSPTVATVSPFNVTTQLGVTCTFDLNYSITGNSSTSTFHSSRRNNLDVEISSENDVSTTTLVLASTNSFNILRGSSIIAATGSVGKLVNVIYNSNTYWANLGTITVNGFTFTRQSATRYKIDITQNTTNSTFNQIAGL